MREGLRRRQTSVPKDKGAVIVFGGECATPASASARRTRCIALALAFDGWDVTLHSLLVRPRTPRHNGFHDNGVRFRYSSFFTATAAHRPVAGTLWRMLGFLRLVVDILNYCAIRRPRLVYLYNSSAVSRLLIDVFRTAGIPTVKDYSEWYPCIPSYSRGQRDYWARRAFDRVSGVLAISDEIVRRVKENSVSARSGRLPILSVPILYERPFAETHTTGNGSFLWCGAIDGYIELVFFLVDAFSQFRARCASAGRLELFGRHTEDSAQRIRQAARQGHVEDRIVLRGFVEDSVLHKEMAAASALLLPLFDDDRSRTRFPTKLAEYLGSGTPVIATAVGQLTEFLENRRSALLAQPGSATSFAEGMVYLAEHKSEAREIGLRGKEVAERNFFYQVQSLRISAFFSEVANQTENRWTFPGP